MARLVAATAFILASAVVSMANVSTVARAADIAGKWESTSGPVTITQAGKGYSVAFSLAEGTVTGSLEGNVFEGTWVRKTASQRCETEKDGSAYWGGFRVTFHTPDVFQGWWFACADKLVDGMAVDGWSGARAK